MKLTSSEPDVQTLVRRIEHEDIDLQPDFQRQEVWSTGKKKKLIDTILRDWSIPPIHLVKAADGKLEVLDGQQRLAALRDFLGNKFSVDGRIEPIDSFTQELHGKFFRSLPDDARRQVENFGIRCFTISDYRPDEPSELFYRLNQPMMLTSGEKRNSLYGEARDQLKLLVEFMAECGIDKGLIGFSNARLSYDDVIARLLLYFEQGSILEKGTESRVSDRFRRGDPFSDGFLDRARLTLKSFSVAKRALTEVRLNKASLLSWLIFTSRDPEHTAAKEFFQAFYNGKQDLKKKFFIDESRALFEDRSRLRVTDVTSVLYRDFCLWYSYRFLESENIPGGIQTSLIDVVYDDIQSRDDISFASSVEERVTPNSWGKL